MIHSVKTLRLEAHISFVRIKEIESKFVEKEVPIIEMINSLKESIGSMKMRIRQSINDLSWKIRIRTDKQLIMFMEGGL
jgi:hypothetical protein